MRHHLVDGRTTQRLRGERGWSCVELSKRSGVTDRTIQRIEANEVLATPSTAHKLAAAFGIDVDELLPRAAAKVPAA